MSGMKLWLQLKQEHTFLKKSYTVRPFSIGGDVKKNNCDKLKLLSYHLFVKGV